LWDHERACFSSQAPPTAAADWHRTFAEIERRLAEWKKALPCDKPTSEHPPTGTGGRAVSTELAATARAAVRRRLHRFTGKEGGRSHA
jgi:hypothetical protein